MHTYHGDDSILTFMTAAEQSRGSRSGVLAVRRAVLSTLFREASLSRVSVA